MLIQMQNREQASKVSTESMYLESLVKISATSGILGNGCLCGYSASISAQMSFSRYSPLKIPLDEEIWGGKVRRDKWYTPQHVHPIHHAFEDLNEIPKYLTGHIPYNFTKTSQINWGVMNCMVLKRHGWFSLHVRCESHHFSPTHPLISR